VSTSFRGFAVAGAAVLAVAGCGGGRLSHAEYAKRADAVCSAYQAQVKLLAQPSSYDDVVSYVEKTLPLYEAALKKLAALKPPTADEAGVQAWLAAGRKVAAAQRSLRLAAMRHDLPGTNAAAAQVQATGETSRQAAIALGLTACAAQ